LTLFLSLNHLLVLTLVRLMAELIMFTFQVMAQQDAVAQDVAQQDAVDRCAGSNCDDKAEPVRWMMDAECMCVPGTWEDPCDAIYGGAYTMARNGTDCPWVISN
jgi:hypothetical protein